MLWRGLADCGYAKRKVLQQCVYALQVDVEQSTSPVHATIEERRRAGSTGSKVVLTPHTLAS